MSPMHSLARREVSRLQTLRDQTKRELPIYPPPLAKTHPSLFLQRMAPAEAGEAREIAVGGDPFAAGFNR